MKGTVKEGGVERGLRKPPKGKRGGKKKEAFFRGRKASSMW